MERILRNFMFLVATLLCYTANAQEAGMLPEGYIPCSVSDLAIAWTSADGKNNVEISFNAPTEMISEMDYTKAELSAPITKIEIQRSVTNAYEFQVVYTFDNPEAGAALSWTDANIAFGTYDYKVQVYVDETMDWAYPETVIVGQLPGDLGYDDFTATVDATDPYKVILEVTLPEYDSMGEPLTMPITKAEFGELGAMSFEPKVIYTVTDASKLVAGSKLQYVRENVKDGSHTYTIKLYTAAGSTWPATCDVFIGKDQPGTVQNIVAEVTENGIVVSWEAPVEGMNGGDMGDPADFTYTVMRGANEYDMNAVTLAEGIKELSIVDKSVFTEETKFVYLIQVKSPYGEGYVASSNALVVGPASTLPFTENFDIPLDSYGNTTTEHSTWSKDYSGWFCAWQIGQETFINGDQVHPHNGKGLLYAFYNGWGDTNQWDSFTSGSIDCSSAEYPELTFWLYDLAQGGSDVTLSIQTSTDDVEYTTAKTIVMGNAEEEGWQKVTVALDALKGAARGKIRFLSETNGSNVFAVAIDEMLIQNNPTNGITGVSTTAKTGAAYNQMGQRINNNAKGIVIINGKKFLNK